jgi:lipoprotein-anchoring transpeptidase ErfK/SrfK
VLSDHGRFAGARRGPADGGTQAAPRFRFWRVPPAAVVTVVALAAAAAVVVAAISGFGRGPGPADGSGSIVPPVPVSAAEFAKLTPATTFTTIQAAAPDPDPFTVTGGLVMHPVTAQVLYAAPGQKPVAVLPATELGGPTWVPVVQSDPGWVRVLLPSRPNRATGWIYTGGTAGSALTIRHTAYLIRIQVAARKLSVDDDGASLGTWTVAVGAPATPTPTGRTFLLALLAPPHPTYSPLILPLGAHSNVLSTFGGGPGTVGLHGWPDPSVFGQAVSNGCVRVPATALRLLSRIPLGTLVLITQ